MNALTDELQMESFKTSKHACVIIPWRNREGFPAFCEYMC